MRQSSICLNTVGAYLHIHRIFFAHCNGWYILRNCTYLGYTMHLCGGETFFRSSAAPPHLSPLAACIFSPPTLSVHVLQNVRRVPTPLLLLVCN